MCVLLETVDGVPIYRKEPRPPAPRARALEVGDRVQDEDGTAYEVVRVTLGSAALRPLARRYKQKHIPAKTRIVNGVETVVREAKTFDSEQPTKAEYVSVYAPMERLP
jgi:hypothetical protein